MLGSPACVMRDIDYIVIHCAATPDGSRRYDARDIDAWHAERGFRRDEWNLRRSESPWYPYVGYHRVIEIDGAIEICRTDPEEGAHAKGYNHNSLGVCLLGTRRYTLPQWHALRAVVLQWIDRYAPVQVVGHREIDYRTGAARKDCPGFDVQAWVDGGFEPLEEHT